MFFIGAIVLIAFMFLPTFLLTLFFYRIRGDEHSDKNHTRDRAIITAWAGIAGFGTYFYAVVYNYQYYTSENSNNIIFDFFMNVFIGPVFLLNDLGKFIIGA